MFNDRPTCWTSRCDLLRNFSHAWRRRSCWWCIRYITALVPGLLNVRFRRKIGNNSSWFEKCHNLLRNVREDLASLEGRGQTEVINKQDKRKQMKLLKKIVGSTDADFSLNGPPPFPSLQPISNKLALHWGNRGEERGHTGFHTSHGKSWSNLLIWPGGNYRAEN